MSGSDRGVFKVVNWPAKNYHKRRQMPRVIVLHHTGGSGNVENEVQYLADNKPGVSVHVVIAKDGTRYRMVNDEHVAYHCGYSKVGSLGRPNEVSLGIELINTGNKKELDPWPNEQIVSCVEQVYEWTQKYEIEMITSHAGIDTMGKYDPYKFPWQLFYRLLGQSEA